ncbi:staphylococcal nuclease domain-containing protein 1-like protein [Leptotrombidium deliense]|uniref:Staphylococcal nuclease domain-containing protein 1 n=1 Tax=Leptotrombidium deliense TaxID=299467 RepID=A0A443SJ97_9ACAR|nr:staphylococcal nuclease domain-containing protein 1-like protein [Leptotrombidium deliense]
MRAWCSLDACFVAKTPVLSGDTVIIRGTPRGGPPPEASVSLAYISAPKIGRKIPSKDGEEAKIINDEPYAWEAREFLRKLLIGKEVTFRYEYTIPTTIPNAKARECGHLFVNDNENVADKLVSEGLAKVIRRKQNESNEDYQRLIALEEEAATRSKPEALKRTVKFDVDDETQPLEKKSFRGIVEDVIDGSTLRVGLLFDTVYQYITIMLAGIKCPPLSDKIGAEAKFFTECRLLNKEVDVHVAQQSSETQRNKYYGSIIVDNKNIAEFLLREGMARLMSNSLNASMNSSALRAAEKEAKTKKLRLFKDYTEAKASESDSVEVVEVINGDALKVKNSKNEVRKIFLSSIRPPPKPEGFNDKSKLLYDIPLMFEAREFLRKRLIGKRVQVTTDYKQPARSTESGKPDLAEKECCTVIANGSINVAEALVSKGLATVVKHRDNDPRSSQYDALLDAEQKAQKTKRGIYATPAPGPYRIVDLSNDAQKAKHHLNFLQRGSANGRLPANVEYVYSTSRVKVYVPKENSLLNLILQGINAPKANEEYGNEGVAFVRNLVHQRDVEITVESMDKLGNFIGMLYFDNKNLSLELVKSGYASVRDSKHNQLVSAEEEAKKNKLNIWKNYVEKEVTNDEDDSDQNDSTEEEKRKEVMVTNISPQMTSIYIQKIENESKLEELVSELREELATNPPLPGSYQIKKNEVCAAKFSADGQWYRAKVEKISKSNSAEVLFIDYGNREEVAIKDLAPLPSSKFSTSDLSAKEYGLAIASLPASDLEVIEEAKAAFQRVTKDKVLLMKIEYKDSTTGLECVTLFHDKKDVVRDLVSEGYFAINTRGRRERRLEKLVNGYKEAQENARRKRLNIWRYGDFTEDDANEFGLGK